MELARRPDRYIRLDERHMRALIAFAVLIGCFPLTSVRAAEDGPLYVTKEGLDCVVGKSADYLAVWADPIHLSVQACLRGMDASGIGDSIGGLDLSGTGRGGGGSSFGSGIGHLSQTIGGASRTSQDSNVILATDALVLSKDQLRCLAAEAANLPVVKDAYDRDVVRIDGLACMKTS